MRWPARFRHVSAYYNRGIFTLLRQPACTLVRSLWWVPVDDDAATIRQLAGQLARDLNAKCLRRLLLDMPPTKSSGNCDCGLVFRI